MHNAQKTGSGFGTTRWCLSLLAFVVCGLHFFGSAFAAPQISGSVQVPPVFSPGAAASSSTGVRTISGRVINAVTGSPVPRALVNVNSRAVLTDAQGAFQFPNFTEAQAFATVSKPGYSAGLDASDANRNQRIANLDAPVELKLYPDALITGTVTGSDGLPLSRVQVRLSRLSYEAVGARWNNTGFSQTNAHGEFRFSQPGGRYRLETSYEPLNQDVGQAVLPVVFPENNGDSASSFFSVTSGEQRQVDLRPRLGVTYPLTVHVQGVEEVRNVRLSAVAGSGMAFYLMSQAQGAGDLRVNLPAGSYTLRAFVPGRDDSLEGTGRVTMTAQGTHEVTLQLAPAAVFPLEIAAEPAGTAVSTSGTQAQPGVVPNGRTLNLSLQNRANTGDSENLDVTVTPNADGSNVFRVRPGRYRLAGNTFGAWYVKSATCGVTNLLNEDLVVGPSAAGSPIRVVLSNATGRLHGTVSANGQPAGGWIYLLPEEPSIVPYREVTVQMDGSFNWQGPEGRYTLVALDRRVHGNFRDPEFRKSISSLGQAVQVTYGSDAAVNASLASVPPGTP